MKFRITSALVGCWIFLSSVAQAESFTYQPDWQKGDTVRYETTGNFQYKMANFPILERVNSQVFSFRITTRHQVIAKTDEFIEFAVSIEKYEFDSPVIDLLVPNWRTEIPRLWKIDVVGLEKLICTTEGLFSYQMDSDGEIIKFTQLEKWNSFYNQYLKFIDPEKKHPRVTKKTEASALKYLDRQFNHSAPYAIYFGFHERQFFKQPFELAQLSPTELTYRNGKTRLVLSGTTQATKENQQVTIQSTYPFSDQLIQVNSNPSNYYSYSNAIYIGNMTSGNPLGLARFAEMPNLKGFSFEGNLTSTFKFNTTESFPTFLSHQIDFSGNLHPDQFSIVQTRSKTPVPFQGSFSLVSTKLSESQNRGGK